jgi:FixJ family two-component response regulator
MGGKVYVIDDDPAMRDSLDFLLGSAGFNVRLFDSALAFLSELANLEAGCVVTDVRMPRLSGPALAAHLARLERSPAILFVSGFTDPDVPGEVLAKPFQPDALLSAGIAAAQPPRLDGPRGVLAAECKISPVDASSATTSRRSPAVE